MRDAQNMEAQEEMWVAATPEPASDSANPYRREKCERCEEFAEPYMPYCRPCREAETAYQEWARVSLKRPGVIGRDNA